MAIVPDVQGHRFSLHLGRQAMAGHGGRLCHRARQEMIVMCGNVHLKPIPTTFENIYSFHFLAPF